MGKKFITLLCIFLFPIAAEAYSNKILVGGESIGINIHSKGVYIVGFYKVNGKNIGEDAGFLKGDIILRVNDKDINSINSLNDSFNNVDSYNFTVLRNNREVSINFKPMVEDNMIKTGLFVKDEIRGIGTLSYIDPETRIYGSLGHEIVDSSTDMIFSIDNGFIYDSMVYDISRSVEGEAGGKNANVDTSNVLGNILDNDITGIYGFMDKINDNKDLIEVGSISDIKKGDAIIKTVIDGKKVEDFSINIKSIDEFEKVKNIFFEITDKKLLSKAGGIVQGMSGSPIIQDNKIIGVVNYVVVDNPKLGYGIFITRMLEEGDSINS